MGTLVKTAVAVKVGKGIEAALCCLRLCLLLLVVAGIALLQGTVGLGADLVGKRGQQGHLLLRLEAVLGQAPHEVGHKAMCSRQLGLCKAARKSIQVFEAAGRWLGTSIQIPIWDFERQQMQWPARQSCLVSALLLRLQHVKQNVRRQDVGICKAQLGAAPLQREHQHKAVAATLGLKAALQCLSQHSRVPHTRKAPQKVSFNGALTPLKVLQEAQALSKEGNVHLQALPALKGPSSSSQLPCS